MLLLSRTYIQDVSFLCFCFRGSACKTLINMFSHIWLFDSFAFCIWSRIIMPMCFPPCQWQGNSFWQLQMLLGGLSSDLLLVLTDIGAAYIFQVELYKVSNINEMCWDCRAVQFFVQFAMSYMLDSLWKNTFAGWLSWLFPQLLPWPTFIGTRQRKMETMQLNPRRLECFPPHIGNLWYSYI